MLLPYDPMITLLNIYPREIKTYVQKAPNINLYTFVHCSLIDGDQISSCLELRMVDNKVMAMNIKK